jgi:hypothetical protein
MGKATGKRGHKSKAEEVLSRKATQHHDFVGQAEGDREQSRAIEQQRIRRDQKDLEKEVVQEMATELEQMAGVAQPPPAPETPPREATSKPPFEMPKNLREGIDLLRRRGPEALEMLRAKAEQRLEQMPAPVKGAVHLTERAVGLALWPVRASVHFLGRVLETPAALVRILLARRTA